MLSATVYFCESCSNLICVISKPSVSEVEESLYKAASPAMTTDAAMNAATAEFVRLGHRASDLRRDLAECDDCFETSHY